MTVTPRLIVRLMILNRCRFRFRIQMRRHLPDHFNGPHTVRDGHHRIAIDTLARGPLPPLAVHLPASNRKELHPDQRELLRRKK